MSKTTSPASPRPADLPIRMLHDRLLVDPEVDASERQSSAGLVIPATAVGPKRLAWAVVVTVVLIAGGFGLLSRSGSTPDPAELPAATAALDPESSSVVVGLTSSSDLRVEVDADGATDSVEVRRGEERTFEADDLLTLVLPDGGPATITVNGTGPIEVARGSRAWSDAFSDTSIVPPPAKQRAREARANAAIEDARLEAAREAESGSGLAPTGVPSVPAAPS